MIQSVKAHAKRVLASAAPFVAVLTAVALTDLLLQREVRTQLEMFFEDPFLSGLFRFGRALKWGLLLSGVPLRPALPPLLPIPVALPRAGGDDRGRS